MEIDKSLFEDMSKLYMEENDFPPLTANIYTLLLFDIEHEGITFDEIMEATQASKSSVSNALNRLTSGNFIEYYTKIEERKRYYRINKNIFKINFLNKLHKVKEEHSLLQRYADHRFQNGDENSKSIKKLKLHIKLKEDIIQLYNDTINSINKINN